MIHLIARQNVKDFAAWRDVFDSHFQAQREAGLSVMRVTRGVDDPNEITVWFEVSDLVKARAFTTSSEIPGAKAQSGVIGQPELYFVVDA